MSVRGVVGGFGRAFVAAGLILLLFVAYQLWGTGLSESRHQASLTRQLDKELARRPAGSPSTTTTTGGLPAGGQDVLPAPAGGASSGQPVAFLTIPKINLHNVVVVEGTATSDLRLGPGHYTGTPMPGQVGNAAIAGHRTTYNAPFYNLDQLARSDLIELRTLQGTFDYAVTSSRVVDPSDTAVLDPPPPGVAELTLTTCNPRYSASQRLVVQALLSTGNAQPAPAAHPTTVKKTASRISGGLGGSSGAALPAVWWGLGCAFVWLCAWLVGRRRRRWQRRLVYAGGTLVFLGTLFFFFGALSPLLPASF